MSYSAPMAALLGRLGATLSPPLKRALTVLTEVWLTLIALTCFATAGYLHSLTVGLLVTGAAAFALEWQIADVLKSVRRA